jgi:AraC family transcriptional activator of tynA and feaB
MTTGLAGGRFEVTGPTPRERLRAWSNAYVGSRIADAVWIPDSVTSFRGRMRRRSIRDLVLVEVESDPFGARWTSASTAAEYVGVSVKTRAFEERVVMGDRRQFVSTTSMDVWDATLLVEAESLSPMAQTMVLVPKAALRMSNDRSLLVADGSTDQDEALLRLLRSVVLAVAADADRFGAAAAAAARNAVVDLLSSLVQERCRPSGAAVSEYMRLAVIAWVDENLSRGALSAREAADQHGISLRSLHRLFQETGDSFGSLVRRRRLEGAGRDLLRTGDMVQSIAMRWGFADASHFISQFKAAHGMTPTAFRQGRPSVP